MCGLADSFLRISSKIKRELKPIAVISAAGRLRCMKASELPRKFNTNSLVGIYDATKPTFCEQSLDDDLVYAEKFMNGGK